MKRAQSSIEFMILLIAGFSLFLALAFLSEARSDEQLRSSDFLYAKKVTDRVAAEINQLYLGGPGTNISFFVPDTLENNAPFELALYPGRHEVEITWEYDNLNKTYTSPIVGGLILGDKINLSGEVNLSNTGSVLYIGVIENEYDFCVSLGLGYTHGFCYQNPNKCADFGLIYEPLGDSYCTGGPNEDTLCCGTTTADDYCSSIGYDQGICRQNPNMCAHFGEVYEPGGDIYCIAGPSADTNCCLTY